MKDGGYADDRALLTNTSAKAESPLHSLEQEGWGIRFNVNANKTQYPCFKQKEAIFSLISKFPKLEDQFTYLSSNILIIEMISIYASEGINYDWQVIDHMEFWSIR